MLFVSEKDLSATPLDIVDAKEMDVSQRTQYPGPWTGRMHDGRFKFSTSSQSPATLVEIP